LPIPSPALPQAQMLFFAPIGFVFSTGAALPRRKAFEFSAHSSLTT